MRTFVDKFFAMWLGPDSPLGSTGAGALFLAFLVFLLAVLLNVMLRSLLLG